MKLYAFQESVARRIDHFQGRALVAADMGTGKTIIATEWIYRRQPWPCVVVAPASVCPFWKRIALEMHGMECVHLRGQKTVDLTKQRGITATPPRLVVINYNVFQYWAGFIKKMRPKTFIIDESQMLANRSTNWTKAIRQSARRAKYILALSGTPLVNRPAELWPTLNLLYPEEFGSFWEFGRRYCGPQLTPWGWQFRGASRVGELHRRLNRTCMIRVHKEEALKELPRKQIHRVNVHMRRRSEYEQCEQDFIVWLSQQSGKKAKRALAATSLAQMGYLRRLAAKLKSKDVVRWVNERLEAQKDKIVVFCVHHKMMHVIKKHANTEVVTISGHTPVKKRADIVKQFVHSDRVRVCVCQIRAAGTGLDGLQHGSHTVAFAELDWPPGVHSQASDRVHRIGQYNQVNVFYLVTERTIEDYMCNVILKKQEISSQILDGKIDAKDFSVFHAVLKNYGHRRSTPLIQDRPSRRRRAQAR